MKTISTILLVAVSYFGYAQHMRHPGGLNYTVSTFLNSPDADVDDALAFDSEGNLYGSNFAGNSVYKITPSGEVSTFVTGLSNPNGLAFDSRDNLYVAEYSGSAIHKYDIDGNLLQTYPIDGFPSGMISAYHSDNVIFTTADFNDEANNMIAELSPDGNINVLHQGAPINLGVGLAYGPGGTLYIGDYLDREIYRLTRNGDLEYVATVPAPDNFVPYLAFIAYAQGYLYGTVYGENKIYRINPRKVDDVEIFAGSTYGDTDGPLSEATFGFPAGIIANRSGNTLYVSEFSGVGNIRKIKRGGGRPCYTRIKLNAYPNPASGQLNIRVESSDADVQLIIYDKMGQKVYEETYETSDNLLISNIDLTGWDSGLYELKVTSGDNQTSRRIVVR
ncbi:T9SS type A sorting domain-containing protein [Reichenbachiella sp.]